MFLRRSLPRIAHFSASSPFARKGRTWLIFRNLETQTYKRTFTCTLPASPQRQRHIIYFELVIKTKKKLVKKHVYTIFCSHLRLNNTSTRWDAMRKLCIFVSIFFYNPCAQGGAVSSVPIVLDFFRDEWRDRSHPYDCYVSPFNPAKHRRWWLRSWVLKI